MTESIAGDDITYVITFLTGAMEWEEPVFHTKSLVDFWKLSGGAASGFLRVREDPDMQPNLLECRSTGVRMTW